jgi:hypothetical protein
MKLKVVFILLVLLLSLGIYANSSVILLAAVLAKIVLILLYFMELRTCHQLIIAGILLFFSFGTSLIILWR